MKARRTPQEKKRLSYECDYVFFSVNNDKSSRKSWPAKKARVNQEFRRKVNQALRTSSALDHDEVETAAKNIQREKIRQWGKISLGEAVQYDRAARATRHGRHKALHAYYDANGITYPLQLSKPRRHK
jgi:hypothetical protein